MEIPPSISFIVNTNSCVHFIINGTVWIEILTTNKNKYIVKKSYAVSGFGWFDLLDREIDLMISRRLFYLYSIKR